jgi:hypothetical protein
MDRRISFVAACAVMVLTMACMDVRLPQLKKIETGPTVTEEILVPLAGGGTRNVEIAMGLGKLDLQPGAENALVEGEVSYNVPPLKPEVTLDDGDVRIAQGKLEGIVPELDQGLKNDWTLRLGSTPMALKLTVGAVVARIEVGGLALEELVVSQGASDFDLSFSELNRADMNALRVTAGASNMTLSGLANANAEDISFKGGAGSYKLRFDGQLRRDVDVSIDAGLGSVVVVVPEGVAAEATFEGAATDVDAVHEWTLADNGYVLEGDGPKVTLRIKMGVGSLELRNK